MHNENEVPGQAQRRRWPWIMLVFVVLFFALAVIWMLALVQRVKRMRDANTESRSAPAAVAAPATNAPPPATGPTK